jgi:hypothetical protein
VIVVAVEAARARVGRRVRMVVVKCILKVWNLMNARMRMRMRCLNVRSSMVLNRRMYA